MESLNFSKNEPLQTRFLPRNKLILICLGALGVAVVAVTIFKVSFVNILFFGILLACLLMHLFMMKSHREHKGKER